MIDLLQAQAEALNIPFQRPKDDALLLGTPPQLCWTQNFSTRTPMESVQVLKHPNWLSQRLTQADVAKPALKNGREVRLLVAEEYLIAAQVKVGTSWQDVTEQLHPNVLEIAAGIMHAIYCPGHALLTLTLSDLTADPKQKPWGVDTISLQPDLAVFYTNVDQPRDVVPALLTILWNKAQ